MNVKRMLFVCVENANRSQMAEAFARMLGGPAVAAYSAGSQPSGVVNPKAIESMRELGYDLSKHGSKSLDELPDMDFDFVATMGCGDACPMVRARRREDWSIPDPKQLTPDEFRAVRDMIRDKVRSALTELGVPVSKKVDLFYSTYGNFEADVLARVRQKTFGEDFGQNSWTTADEYRRWIRALDLREESVVLEVASGSGGPAIFLAQQVGCRVHGVDINANGVAIANEKAGVIGLTSRVSFAEADANEALPFSDETFDAIFCIDSANHFPERLRVLREWHRVLRPRGKAVFTDPVVVTGLVTNDELALRSSIGYFVFAPPGVNERLIEQADFSLLNAEDVTENAAMVSKRWLDARSEDREALIQLEGEERYEGLQRFFEMVHRLTSERRVSRFAYHLQKR